jgi:hypothetical protein
MAESPFQIMAHVVKGRETPDVLNGIEFLATKAIGFIKPKAGMILTKYQFVIDRDIYRGLLFVELEHGGKMPSWIKKKKTTEDALDKVMKEYWEKMDFDPRILTQCREVGRKYAEENIREILQVIQADVKTCKKFGVEFDKPKVVEQPKMKTLDDW